MDKYRIYLYRRIAELKDQVSAEINRENASRVKIRALQNQVHEFETALCTLNGYEGIK